MIFCCYGVRYAVGKGKKNEEENTVTHTEPIPLLNRPYKLMELVSDCIIYFSYLFMNLLKW